MAQGSWSPTCSGEQARDGLRSKTSQNGLSFVPFAPPGSDSASRSGSQQHKHRSERGGSAHVSPFRSVRRMRKPFPLVLPTSPSFDGRIPSLLEPGASRASNGRPMLRSWRSEQNLVATNFEAFGLLPSPSLSDPTASCATPMTPDFPKQAVLDPILQHGQSHSRYSTDLSANGNENDHPIQIVLQTQADTTQIPTMCLAPSRMTICESENEKASTGHDISPCTQVEPHSPIRTPPKLSSGEEEVELAAPPLTIQEGRPRADTVSSTTSNWTPNNLTYCERWLQGVPDGTQDLKDEKSREMNRRKFQIVQKTPPISLNVDTAATGRVRFAVANKTKPKLVEISRQSSLSLNRSASVGSQLEVPQTPDQRPCEVSAFSPDTPFATSDSGYVSEYSEWTDLYYDDDGDDDTDSGSANSGSITSTIVCSTSTVNKERASILRNNTKDLPESQPAKLLPSLIFSSSQAEKAALEKLWDQEWTLKQLDHAVKDFPRSMLRLTSPVIMFLRQSNEKSLLRPFRKIFPDVTESLLGALCSVLIAQNYIYSITTSERKAKEISTESDPSRLGIIPEKARTTLGIQYLNATPHQTQDHEVLSSRAIELRKDLDSILDKLLFAICGRFDDMLKNAIAVLVQVLESRASSHDQFVIP